MVITKESGKFAVNKHKYDNMESTIATTFTPAQIQILKMFDADKTEEGLQELKEVLFNHYYKKMNDSLNELWESGALDQKRLDEINEMDLHQI